MKFDILTLFPDMIHPYLEDSILKRAQEKKLIEVELHDWREFSKDKHRAVDDSPYGGGTGMVLQVQPIYDQLKELDLLKRNEKTKVFMMAPDGEQFTHAKAVEFSKLDRLVLIAGRYEGFDKRIEEFVDGKVSVGPYVLSGGELPALTILEATARQIPEVIGHSGEALKNETFVDGETDFPQYTRPETFKTGEGGELKVPEVLLSGDHKKIAEWRKSQQMQV